MAVKKSQPKRSGVLPDWRGWCNYPVSTDDKISAEGAVQITELWLFKGKKEQRNYKVEFAGIKTRRELIDDYGYPAKGKAHSDKYLLFKTAFQYQTRAAYLKMQSASSFARQTSRLRPRCASNSKHTSNRPTATTLTSPSVCRKSSLASAPNS
ncbi:MAG: hypothetical protein ACI4RD_04375 [Kiritimatiellia bacterium]